MTRKEAQRYLNKNGLTVKRALEILSVNIPAYKMGGYHSVILSLQADYGPEHKLSNPHGYTSEMAIKIVMEGL